MNSLEFEHWLVIENMNELVEDNSGNATMYRYTFDKAVMFPIGHSNIPVMDRHGKYIGVGTVQEIHMNAYGTTVFFTISDDLSEKEQRALERAYAVLYPNAAVSQEYDTPKAFRNSAAAMDLGLSASPSDTFRKKSGKGRSTGALSDLLGADFDDF